MGGIVNTRAIFGRIGWMRRYQGVMPGDDHLFGGGEWNKKHAGEERYNFLPVRGRVYGFFQPSRAEAIDFAVSYSGPNLMMDKFHDEIDAATHRLESIAAGAGGQGFPSTTADRQAIERHAMRRAIIYFKRRYKSVEDVSSNRSYDLHCTGRGRHLRVEVKGTTTPGHAIIVTPREVELARRRPGVALYLLTMIKVHNGKARGGKEIVVDRWTPTHNALEPISYFYHVPTRHFR
jgi:hypothetical protein